jgi:nucleoside-triphosphatase THEP1
MIKLTLRIRNIIHCIFHCRKRYSINTIKHKIKHNLSNEYKDGYDEDMYFFYTESSRDYVEDEIKHDCCYWRWGGYDNHRCHSKEVFIH